MDFIVHSKETVYQGFFNIDRLTVQHDLYDGTPSRKYTRELFQRGHAASVLMYDPVEDVVVLVEQFRVGAIESCQPWVLEMVAGMIEGFVKFPPRQKPASFNLDAVMRDLEAARAD